MVDLWYFGKNENFIQARLIVPNHRPIIKFQFFLSAAANIFFDSAPHCVNMLTTSRNRAFSFFTFLPGRIKLAPGSKSAISAQRWSSGHHPIPLWEARLPQPRTRKDFISFVIGCFIFTISSPDGTKTWRNFPNCS